MGSHHNQTFTVSALARIWLNITDYFNILEDNIHGFSIRQKGINCRARQ